MKIQDALDGALAPNSEIKNLDSKPPEGSAVKSSFALEAQIENKPQELKKIRSFFAMTNSVPSSLKPEAQIVLQALFSCFDKQKTVQEGKIDDLVWGFEQAGIPGPAVVVGLAQLEKDGFVRFQAPDNQYVEMTKDNITSLWVRYEKKLLELVYEGASSI